MANNISANLPSPTELFFNNFFKPQYTLAQNVDDASIAFFEKITKNKESARLMASAVIYTSLATNIDPMETLAKFSSLGEEELLAYTTLFLNLNRVGTSYLGINTSPKISKYVQRSLLP
jgi:hypothetical protein